MNKLYKLIQEIEQRAVGETRVDPFARPRFGMALDERDMLESRAQPVLQQCYRLELRVRCEYWANSAQRPEARKRAEENLYYMLYRDVVGELMNIRGMLDTCTRSELDAKLRALIRELQP